MENKKEGSPPPLSCSPKSDSGNDNGLNLENGKPKSVATYEPFEPSNPSSADETTLFVTPLPLSMSYEVINEVYGAFGKIEEIRVKLTKDFKFWEVWISYSSSKMAYDAFCECKSNRNVEARLVKDIPYHLDVFYPNRSIESSENSDIRSPPPPKWLIVSSTQERANLYAFRRALKEELGEENINSSQISRFGNNSFLICAKSVEQAAMICNLRKTTKNTIKEVKPHYNFSYARGVIFNRDLHEFPENEILEMCPSNVWRVFKVPRSSMITLTFIDDHLPLRIEIEKEILNVKPFKPRPLQCFNCFGFGHPSRRCAKDKVCNICSQSAHGDCARQDVCLCKL